jgi:hypothetical protein
MAWSISLPEYGMTIDSFQERATCRFVPDAPRRSDATAPHLNALRHRPCPYLVVTCVNVGDLGHLI